MSIHLEIKELINAQQMEVAVNGPDGATHLILCTGVLEIVAGSHGTYTFLIGPQLSRRQFVGAIASGALSTIRAHDKQPTGDNADAGLEANIVSIHADYDDEAGQVKVRIEISASIMTKLAISYNVSILAEMPIF